LKNAEPKGWLSGFGCGLTLELTRQRENNKIQRKFEDEKHSIAARVE
jgi:hypothetical protein